MANQTRLIRLTWENGNLFKMEDKLNDAAYTTIIEMHENSDIAKLWNNAQSIYEIFFKTKLDSIGTEMKA